MEARRIIELGVGDVDRVEELWKEMVGHHREVADGRLAPRDPDAAWAARRRQFVAWLEAGEGVIFLVPGEDAAAPLGFAFLRIEGPPGNWDLGEVVGDLESLSVAAAARGQGIGTELIERCREHLRGLGAKWWSVTVVAANGRAIELYEREGFWPYSQKMLAPIE